jgi:hypothetical protein
VLSTRCWAGRLGLARRAAQPGLRAGGRSHCDLVLISHAGAEFLHPPTLRACPRSATWSCRSRCAGLVSRFASPASSSSASAALWCTAAWGDLDGGSPPRPGLRLRAARRRPRHLLLRASGYFSGFAEVGARFRPDVALLPISGLRPARLPRRGNMSPSTRSFAFRGSRRPHEWCPSATAASSSSYERLDEPIRWLRRLVARARSRNRTSPSWPSAPTRKFVDLDKNQPVG